MAAVTAKLETIGYLGLAVTHLALPTASVQMIHQMIKYTSSSVWLAPIQMQNSGIPKKHCFQC